MVQHTSFLRSPLIKKVLMLSYLLLLQLRVHEWVRVVEVVKSRIDVDLNIIVRTTGLLLVVRVIKSVLILKSRAFLIRKSRELIRDSGSPPLLPLPYFFP